MSTSNGTGTGTGAIGKMKRLLAEARAKVEALESTLAMLGEVDQESATKRARQTLTTAIGLDNERTTQRKVYASPQEKVQRFEALRQFLRQHPESSAREVHDAVGHTFGISIGRTQQLLNEMKPEVEGVGPLQFRRYRLRQERRSAAVPKKTQRTRKERRRVTAKLLAHFDPATPHPRPRNVPPVAVNSLVNHGYLTPTPDGLYLRTEKPFSPEASR